MVAGAANRPGIPSTGLHHLAPAAARRPARRRRSGCPPWCGEAERRRRVALRVEVEDQDAQAVQGQRGGDVDRRRRLSDAALLVGHRQDPGHRRRREVPGAAGPDLDRGLRSRGDRGVVARRSSAVSRETSGWPRGLAHPPLRLLGVGCPGGPADRAPATTRTTVVGGSTTPAPDLQHLDRSAAPSRPAPARAASTSARRRLALERQQLPARPEQGEAPAPSRSSGATARAVTTSTGAADRL